LSGEATGRDDQPLHNALTTEADAAEAGVASTVFRGRLEGVATDPFSLTARSDLRLGGMTVRLFCTGLVTVKGSKYMQNV
jgi:hypothetical protein